MHQPKKTAHSKRLCLIATSNRSHYYLSNTTHHLYSFFFPSFIFCKFADALLFCYYNHRMMTNNTSSSGPDFLFSPSPTHRIITNFASSSSPDAKYQQSARKKRSKLVKIDASPTSSSCSGSVVSKPKYAKKPDPAAPKITKPCSECGKKFWSWKALFGHMRCHPERQWRGINPPPNFQRPEASLIKEVITNVENVLTVEDREVAECLLMLANGDGGVCTSSFHQGVQAVQDVNEVNLNGGGGGVSCRFECSSCKKVFGSHQALGGHRASHKNVKGCFAITRSDGDCHIIDHHDHHFSDDGMVMTENLEDHDERTMMMVLGHKCSVCLRVFSSGQALGGHKRCHWEKGDDPLLNQGLNSLDLNLPAPVDDDSACSSYSSGLLALNLRLGL